MAKKTRIELSTLAINTNLPDNTQELITPTTERSQLTDERESVINYKDDLGGAPNAGKFLTVAVDGESLTMVDEPSGVPDWVTFITAVRNQMLLKAGGDGTGTSEAWLKFTSYDGTITSQINFNGIDGNFYINGANSQISLTSAILFVIGGTPRLTISSGGDATFSGDITLVNETTTTSQATLAIKGKQTTAGNYPVGEIVFFNNNDSFATIAGVRDGADDKGALLFQTQNGTAGFGTRLTISSGGLATFANGIKFGTGATLDAYEEGTWTPVIKFGTSTAETHYTPQAVYTRIGRVVYIQCTVANITKNGSGDLTIEGLPFPVGAVGTFGNTQGNFRWGNINLPTNGTHIDSYLSQATSKIAPQIIGTSGYISGVSNTFVSATTWEIYGLSAFYMI